MVNSLCSIASVDRVQLLLKKVMADPRTVVTRGSTFENAVNLAKPFLDNIKAKYEGTRLGRQELEAEVLDDVPGSLWTREILDKTRRKRTDKLPDMQRVVVAIDPAGKSQETAISEGTPPPLRYSERTVCPGPFGAIITTSRSTRGTTWL